jgi:hypothetical protein
MWWSMMKAAASATLAGLVSCQENFLLGFLAEVEKFAHVFYSFVSI